MGDLLVCLGQEEAKVKLLVDKLSDMGVDTEQLLAEIGDFDDEENMQGGGDGDGGD